MMGDRSEGVLKQLQRLFNLGAVGAMTDAQLLEWFVSRRDPEAAAAFEELVIRHGPMVLDVCRRVLGDVHDAEDGFQATFLVLADRARSIIRRESVGSWLFGVAYRVSSRARVRAARQRASERMITERTPEAYIPVQVDLDRDILYAEVARLPDRLRVPIVMCYLQGLTYLEASSQLKVPEGVLRGRLERARKRLHQRLTHRGVTIPAGFLTAVAAGSLQAQAAIPATLVHSTVRIALGFITCETAKVLARGVLSSMLVNQLKVVTALVFVGVVGSLGIWQALAAALHDGAQAPARPDTGRKSLPPPVDATQPQAPAPGPLYRLRGVVRVEGTGEPVDGARLRIMLGDAGSGAVQNDQVAFTGVDGRFAVELVEPGNARLLFIEPPAGYWVPTNQKFMESFVLGPDQPLIDREYHVRKGTIWSLRLTRGAEALPLGGFITGSNPIGAFSARADNEGLVRLTLPTEGGKVTLRVQEGELLAPTNTGFLTLNLEWDPNFRPGELEEVVRLDGNDRRFRLTDADANSATLQGPDSIEPVKENGRLVIRVALPGRSAQDVSAIAGQVIDADGRPIPGVRVALAMGGRVPSNDPWQQTATDAQGRYRLREIPHRTIDGKPLRVMLVVAKEGYVGIQSPPLSFSGDDSQKPQVIQPIRLDRGVSLSGVVVDHRGQRAAGAWVRANYFVRLGQPGVLQSVKADANGRFTIRDLPRHVIALMALHGELHKSIVFLADGSPAEARIELPTGPPEPPPNFGALQAAPPDPPALGQPAPELEVGPWSDRRSHTLASERGKVVVLYFWGLGFDPSIWVLPILGKLAREYEPRGAVFLAIHNAERDPEAVREQARRVLPFKGAPLRFAVDQMRVKFHARGVTADRYGQKMMPPFVVIVDRTGKIAFHSESATGDANVNAIVRQMAAGSVGMSEEQFNERIERALRREIERVNAASQGGIP
jgi:RNA polymerase sigma factor (sigma-70 family)